MLNYKYSFSDIVKKIKKHKDIHWIKVKDHGNHAQFFWLWKDIDFDNDAFGMDLALENLANS